MNVEAELLAQSNKMINKLILYGRKFCDYICTPDGMHDILMEYYATGIISDDVKYSVKVSYDYDYFAFTKSLKSLIAIKTMLNNKDYPLNEDCLLQIRSIFENHIMSRYLREYIDIESEKNSKIKDFIINPLGVTLNFYGLKRTDIIDMEGNNMGKVLTPSRFKTGEECNYYSDFYPFLCEYTHCSFGTIGCYFDEHLFTYRKDNFTLLTRLLAIFVFTKIYEGVVTVNGEDLGNKKDERIYYNLAYDALELQLQLFDFLIAFYNEKVPDVSAKAIEKYLGNGVTDKSNRRIVAMLNKMKQSLFDQGIGNLDKSIIKDNGTFERSYQAW